MASNVQPTQLYPNEINVGRSASKRLGSPFDASQVPDTFALIGYGNLNPKDRSPCTVTITAGTTTSSDDLGVIARACHALGCHAFDSLGRIYVRVRRSELHANRNGSNAETESSSNEIKGTQNESSDVDLPAVYSLDMSPPQHYVDVFFKDCIPDEPFKSLSVDVTFDQDVPQDLNWYLCFFGGHFNHGGFYGGLQTNVGCPAGSTIEEQSNDGNEVILQEEVGQNYGCIFSRWGPATLRDAQRVYSDQGELLSFAEAGGYEGDFVSTRRHVPWGKGKYTLQLHKESEDKQGTWVRYTVTKHASNEDVASSTASIAHLRAGVVDGSNADVSSAGEVFDCGALRFRKSINQKEEALKLEGGQLYQFAEIYGAYTVFADELPPMLNYTVSRLCVNGEQVKPRTQAMYYKHVPHFASVGCDDTRTDWHVKYSIGSEETSGRESLLDTIYVVE